ncbi:phosphoglycerate mutase [Desulfobulbus propionicus DSM 2032]|uniref:2,3-bisphosphoglycerate-independent phosphoglycerate mutase n=1 Tax=Desulfobulbus propionicus (strain ATCC 33891 / DSM 2032 / VKM B-1956 / 1pr3) TaxID=577650 RepID=A0A7U3YKQ7_DESPD|nr:2,3-bisphosphoglycerate-independent phosphoglycerate mutase [Desulfobulbus propionicus]ADW17063.1 phosphoglycerate mutase [Desulfobulbus propionicus DSM 2032]
MSAPVPVILAILDGWGIADPVPTNAVFVAKTPNMDRLSAAYPMTTLVAHNGMVGLPEGQMGNSEVGHLNIGAGRIVYQDFTRINLAVERGELAANPVFNRVMEQVKAADSRLHLCGLVSDGGVHSHLRHLIALIELAAAKGVEVVVHCFMDGRDTPPTSGLGFMEELVAAMARIGCGQVATISGRYWAMDRDKRWDRVKKAWDAMVEGVGPTAADAVTVMREAYARGETDEFLTPTVLVDGQGVPLARIRDNDAVIFFNFRADRVRELCHAFGDVDFSGFDAGVRPRLLALATMTEYEADFPFPVAFPPVTLTHILGEEVSRHGRRQLRIAETEKYAHVTYFFNGGNEVPYPGEDRLLINSPRDVATYDQKPQMSAVEVTDRLLAALAEREAAGAPYDLVILNFANGDMVGHTGIMAAAVAACETVDRCVGRIEQFVRERGGVLLITADHGNAEQMVDPQNSGPYTAHTLSPVPFIVVSEAFRNRTLRPGGALKDIAPTILTLMELPIPKEMEGESLIV